MIEVLIFKLEQADQEGFKTVPYVKKFSNDEPISEVLKWCKSHRKRLSEVYFKEI